MKAQSQPGTSGLGGAPRNDRGISGWDSARGAWSAAMRSMVVEPVHAATAAMSRYANFTLSRQIELAYAAATRARDCARTAAAAASAEMPAGPVRTAVLGALSRNEADGERLMREVLRFGREHAHLAFAFPAIR
jgi:hypothetical protein